jgi:hypothetical protein
MAISPNFLIIDDATRIRAVYDISLDLVETAWIALWRFFPLALAFALLLVAVACAFRCLQRRDEAPAEKHKKH